MGILQTVLDLLILTHISMHTLYHTCRGSLRAVYWQWHTYFVLQIIPHHLLFRASSLPALSYVRLADLLAAVVRHLGACIRCAADLGNWRTPGVNCTVPDIV